MDTITTVIFDIGNVLAQFRWKEYLEEFEFDQDTKTEVAKAIFQSQEWNERDRGLKEEEEYLNAFCANAPKYEEEIRKVHAGLLDVVVEFAYSKAWIEGIKRQGKKVYFLSNYSKLNFEEAMKKFEFLKCADGGVISYQVKQIKPEPDIYKTLLEKYHINPGEAVFLDDLEANLRMAESFGIHTIHVTSHEAAVEGLKAYGISTDEINMDLLKDIRMIQAEEITRHIKEMCMEANYFLPPDMKQAMKTASEQETSPLGKKILEQLDENLRIAGAEKIPICQDTGMAVIFAEIGQEVHIVGGQLEESIQEGVRLGYAEGFLRKSVVGDPLIRENTKDNTPAVIHYSIVAGDQIQIKVAPKGFGSENMSRLFMLKPSDGIDGVKKAVLDTVAEAGPNACPPMVIGVGIGGTFEKCALMAKEALSRELGCHSDIPHIKELEQELLRRINSLGIGPGGLGGITTALGVHINTYPTHIAGLPVAVNICCHVCRHVTRII